MAVLRKGWRPELQAAIADKELDLESFKSRVRKPATCLCPFMAKNLAVGMLLLRVQGKLLTIKGLGFFMNWLVSTQSFIQTLPGTFEA